MRAIILQLLELLLLAIGGGFLCLAAVAFLLARAHRRPSWR
jgi:hypothetical protein